MAAATMGSRTFVRILLDKGASATASDFSYQSTALHLACEALFEEDATGKFAADDRAADGEEEEEEEVNGVEVVVAMLLNAGADPNAIDRSENTPLHLAVEAGGDPPLVLDLWSRPSPAAGPGGFRS
jgi:ankyrin repeat protein